METVLIVVHLFLAIGLVGLVLIQHGKGADMGAAFGSGASASVFGSAGAGNFLTRATAILATLFFLTSLALAYFAMNTGERASVMEDAAPAVIEQSEVPAAMGSEVPVVPEAGADAEVPVVPEAVAPAADVPVIPE
jgi:preprotein translocase subunit SecG